MPMFVILGPTQNPAFRGCVTTNLAPSTFLNPQLLTVLMIQIMIGSYIILECMSFILSNTRILQVCYYHTRLLQGFN